MMNQCDHPRDFTLHSAGRPTLKEDITFGDVLALPEEFLDSTTSAMTPIMMNFFAAKRATHRPLKNPSLAAVPPATSAAMP